MTALEEYNAELFLVAGHEETNFGAVFEKLRDPTATWSKYQESLINAAMRAETLSRESIARVYASI